MSNQEKQLEDELGAVFDELINLIGETKQAIWSASASAQRRGLEALKAYLAEQAVLVDEAAIRLGGRPAWIVSPTGHHPRNLAAEAGGNPARFVDLLVAHLENLVHEIKVQSATIQGEWQLLLDQIAEGLASRVEALKQEAN